MWLNISYNNFVEAILAFRIIVFDSALALAMSIFGVIITGANRIATDTTIRSLAESTVLFTNHTGGEY